LASAINDYDKDIYTTFNWKYSKMAPDDVYIGKWEEILEKQKQLKVNNA
jgi:hypothetical protein